MTEIQQELKTRFQERSWRLTLAVREIFKTLEVAPGLYSAYEISKILDEKFDVTTVYRVLEKLQEVKLVHEFQGRWKLCTDPHNHEESHHFLICDRCGQAEEIFLDYHEAIAGQLAKEKAFVLKKVHLGFLGTCRKCHL